MDENKDIYNLKYFNIKKSDKFTKINNILKEASNTTSSNNSIKKVINLNNLNKLDLYQLESIRLSQTLENKDYNSQLLLDRMAGIKSSNKNLKPTIYDENKNNKEKIYFESGFNEEEKNLNTINTLYTNKELEYKDNKNIYIKTEELSSFNASNNNSIYIKENENNNTDKKSYKQNETNYERDSIKEMSIEKKNYIKNNEILKQQNELFIQLLDTDKKHNSNRNVIISNLNNISNSITEGNECQKKHEVKNTENNDKNKEDKKFAKYKSLNNFNNKFINKIGNIPLNKKTTKLIISKNNSVEENKKESYNITKKNKTILKCTINLKSNFFQVKSNRSNKKSKNKSNNKSNNKFQNNKNVNYFANLNETIRKNNKLIKKKNSYNNVIEYKSSINKTPNLLNRKFNYVSNNSVKSLVKKNKTVTNENQILHIVKKKNNTTNKKNIKPLKSFSNKKNNISKPANNKTFKNLNKISLVKKNKQVNLRTYLNKIKPLKIDNKKKDINITSIKMLSEYNKFFINSKKMIKNNSFYTSLRNKNIKSFNTNN